MRKLTVYENTPQEWESLTTEEQYQYSPIPDIAPMQPYHSNYHMMACKWALDNGLLTQNSRSIKAFDEFTRVHVFGIRESAEYACGCRYPTTEPSRYYDHACATCHMVNWHRDRFAAIRQAAYVMRDRRTGITDGDAWHTLKSAEEYLWAQIPPLNI